MSNIKHNVSKIEQYALFVAYVFHVGQLDECLVYLDWLDMCLVKVNGWLVKVGPLIFADYDNYSNKNILRLHYSYLSKPSLCNMLYILRLW